MLRAFPYQAKGQPLFYPPPAIDGWYMPPPPPVVRPQASPWIWPDFGQIDATWLPAPLVSQWYAPPPGPVIRPQAAPWFWPFRGEPRDMPVPKVDGLYVPPPDPVKRPAAAPWIGRDSSEIDPNWIPTVLPEPPKPPHYPPGPPVSRRAFNKETVFYEPVTPWLWLIGDYQGPQPFPLVSSWYAPPPDPVPARRAVPHLVQAEGGQVYAAWAPPPVILAWYAQPPEPIASKRPFAPGHRIGFSHFPASSGMFILESEENQVQMGIDAQVSEVQVVNLRVSGVSGSAIVVEKERSIIEADDSQTNEVDLKVTG